MLARDIEAYDEYCDRTAPDVCPVCGVDCRCDGPHESIATAIVAAAERVGMLDTVSSIAARKATGDSLVTRGGWSVSFDTSSETGKVARLSCFRWLPGTPFDSRERDVRDGDTFPSSDDAECYALNAGRLRWYSEYKAEKAKSAAPRRIPADPRLAAIADQLAESILATLAAHGYAIVREADTQGYSEERQREFAREAARNAVGIVATEGTL